MTPIDYTALLAPVSRAEITAFKTELRARNNASWVATLIPQIFGWIVLGFIVIVGAVVVLGVGSRAVLALLADPAPETIGASGFGLVVIAGAIAIVVIVIRALLGGKSWERLLRLTRFAGTNGLEFVAQSPNPVYPGSIFGRGHARQSLNRLQRTSGRFLEISNYRYKTGSGKEEQTHNWGYLALRLDRALPHMLLDARANNGLFGGSNLPVSFSKNQVLSLEGDFDQYFTLYCPREYERDALYVFTPDLMALLIDNAAPFDVEIIDDWMFVYSSRPFASLDPAVYKRLFTIIDTVGAKTLSQTDRYVDERVGEFAPNIVAPQGRRLRSGVSVGVVIVIVLVAVFVIAPQLIGGFGMFGMFGDSGFFGP